MNFNNLMALCCKLKTEFEIMLHYDIIGIVFRIQRYELRV